MKVTDEQLREIGCATCGTLVLRKKIRKTVQCEACRKKARAHQQTARRAAGHRSPWTPKAHDRQREWRMANQYKVRQQTCVRARIRRADPEHKQRIRARAEVYNAIRRGDLVRQPCEVCSAKAQAHHDDYSKPLAVRWLCQTHHTEADRKAGIR